MIELRTHDGNESERCRWGRAGERLPATTVEGRRRQHREAQQRQNSAYRRVRAEQETQRRWKAGLVVPHYITTALDAKGLYGPAVDEACGAHEPDVDRWESGDLYPSWAQLCALAKLTEVTVAYFVRPAADALDASWTTLRFHAKARDMPLEPPVLRFKPSARTAMTQATLW